MTSRPIQVLAVGLALSLAGAPAEAQDRVKDLVAQARRAIGGDAVLAGIGSVSVDATVRRVSDATPMELSSELRLDLVMPDKYRRSESVSAGPVSRTVTMALSGEELLLEDGGAAAAMGQDPRVPGPHRVQAIANLKLEAFRYLAVWLLSPPSDVSCAFADGGVAEAPEGTADVLDLRCQAPRNLRLFFDSKTHRLLMATYEMESVDPDAVKELTQRMMNRVKADPQNAAKLAQVLPAELSRLPRKTITVPMRFSDHRPFGAITVPATMLVDVGDLREEWTIRSFKLNPTLRPELFLEK